MKAYMNKTLLRQNKSYIHMPAKLRHQLPGLTAQQQEVVDYVAGRLDGRVPLQGRDQQGQDNRQEHTDPQR